MRRMFSLLFGMSVALLFAGCASTSPGIQPMITVSVAPLAATVAVSQSQKFTATVTESVKGVNWNLIQGGTACSPGCGTISPTSTASGAPATYVAPATMPASAMVTVTATSVENTARSTSATVTLTTQAGGPVAVTPSAATFEVFTTNQFSATINGQATTAVTWQVNGLTGGSTTTGTISSTGLYRAPHSLSNSIIPANGAPVTVQIEAVSTTNTSNVGTATVTLTVPNQRAEPKPIDLGTSGSNVNDSNTSGGKITCCGGTLGALVTRGGTQYILSADHVLARSGAGTAGDPIVEPGLIDTDCSSSQTTTVANLTQGSFNLQNPSLATVDAAIAQVVSGAVNSSANILLMGSSTDANGVPVPGAPNGGNGQAATVNLAVAKSGRTTGLTCSTVGATNVRVSVDYTTNCDGSGTKFTVIYNNQVSVVGGDFSGGGDSGSLIVTQSNATPVALLYAGSSTDTVGNPVSDVLNFFASGGNAVSFVGAARSSPVTGCTLPGPQAPMLARLTPQKIIPSKDLLVEATAVRDAHSAALMGHLEVQAVGVGASYDNPSEPAILLFVTKGQPRTTSLPRVVDGVRTRIVEGEVFARHGLISPEETPALEQSAAPPQLVYPIPETEVARAKIVHEKHVDELMKMTGVQGVGITSSVDAPGEVALMIFLVDGVPHPTIPPEIDGLRTRIRVGSRFHAGLEGNGSQPSCPVPGPKRKQPSTRQKPGSSNH